MEMGPKGLPLIPSQRASGKTHTYLVLNGQTDTKQQKLFLSMISHEK